MADAHTIATTVCPLKYEIIPQVKNAGMPTEAAKPSSPSVRLYAFDAPVIINTQRIGYRTPMSKLFEPR